MWYCVVLFRAPVRPCICLSLSLHNGGWKTTYLLYTLELIRLEAALAMFSLDLGLHSTVGARIQKEGEILEIILTSSDVDRDAEQLELLHFLWKCKTLWVLLDKLNGQSHSLTFF